MIQAFFRASPSTVPPNHPDNNNNNNSISRNSSYESLPSLSTESGAMTGGVGGISSYDDVDNLIPNLLHGGKKIRKLTKKFETNSPPVTVVPSSNNNNSNSVSRSPNHPENSDTNNLNISIADEIVAEEEGIALREEK
jgi:hypothetical protein